GRARRARWAGRRPGADVRRRMGVDLQQLRRLSGFPSAARRGGRVQRQVHERAAGAARRQLRHPARARPRHLPELLPAGCTLAVQRAAAGGGRRVNPAPAPWRLTDLQPRTGDLRADALEGLSARPRRLPSKYFYDASGSRLFEQITRQPEYYPTRVETAMLQQHAPAIARAIGPDVHLVEYGSGSGRKTELLLEGLDGVVAYTPVEISREALLASVERLARLFPAVEMLPVCADFTAAVALPEPARPARSRLLFFPGSTLGNFERDEAVGLLRSMRATMGDDGAALVGIDLDKDPAVIEAAYNDAAGVTAAFTLNL